jgi:hypothetical protein
MFRQMSSRCTHGLSKVWISRLALILIACGLAALHYWLCSPRRLADIHTRKVSCMPIPWWLFNWRREAQFDGSFSHVESNGTLSSIILDGEEEPRSISHLQACSMAYSSSSHLETIIQNHVKYCKATGIGYDLYTGGNEGFWVKQAALLKHIKMELIKPVELRTDWIL